MALASVVVVLIVCRLPSFAFIAAGGLHPLRQQEPPDVYAIIAQKKTNKHNGANLTHLHPEQSLLSCNEPVAVFYFFRSTSFKLFDLRPQSGGFSVSFFFFRLPISWCPLPSPPPTPPQNMTVCVSQRVTLCSVCATAPAVAGVNSLDVLHVKGSLGAALVELRPLRIDCSVLEKTVVQGYSQSASRRVQRRTVAQ